MNLLLHNSQRGISSERSLFYLEAEDSFSKPGLRIRYKPKADASLITDESSSGHILQLPVISSCPLEPFIISVLQGPVRSNAPFQFWKNESRLIGCAILEVSDSDLEEQTYCLYNKLFDIADGANLYRIWAWIPRINEFPQGGVENYRSFCLGRSRAFADYFGPSAESRMPAASGVGMSGNRLVVLFLGGMEPAEHRENPRQIPAYKYSQHYGPQPPSFARATFVNSQPDSLKHLFISGTAAIIASESQYSEDLLGQLAITVENLKLMGVESSEAHLSQRFFRVYLRHQDLLTSTQAYLKAHLLKEKDPVIYTINDICRQELLVEIEASLIL